MVIQLLIYINFIKDIIKILVLFYCFKLSRIYYSILMINFNYNNHLFVYFNHYNNFLSYHSYFTNFILQTFMVYIHFIIILIFNLLYYHIVYHHFVIFIISINNYCFDFYFNYYFNYYFSYYFDYNFDCYFDYNFDYNFEINNYYCHFKWIMCLFIKLIFILLYCYFIYFHKMSFILIYQ